MTKSPRGPSLTQARDLATNKHPRSHQHRNRSPSPYRDDSLHQHQHQHRHHQQHQQPQERQVPDAADAVAIVDSHIIRVVQTISIVQVVDGAGNPIQVQTHFAEPATVVVDAGSGVTVSAPSLGGGAQATTPEPEAATIPTYLGETVPVPTPDSSSLVDLAESAAVPVSASSELPVESLDGISTSALSTPALGPAAPEPSVYHTISLALNSTHPSSFHSLSNNSSTIRLLAVPESSSASASAPASSSSSSSTSTRRSSSLFTTTTTLFTSSTTSSASGAGDIVEPTAAVGDDGSGAQGDAGSGSTTASDGSGDSTPETGVIVGSVFGSIAGLALIAVLVLLALRWKKRNGGQIALGDELGRGTRGALTAGAGSSPDHADTGMTQRSMSWGAGALAGIAAKRASRNAPAPPPSPPAESAERGFYRVSGRKLPSVFESGGDGYTDPRENPFGNHNRASAMSGDSVLYRDSQAFFDEPSPSDALGRLAVGSPMRPVSGVPIMRSGPAKTPVTESNPFADPAAPTLQPPPTRDAIGRSLGSQDGSRGSGSRFTEEII